MLQFWKKSGHNEKKRSNSLPVPSSPTDKRSEVKEESQSNNDKTFELPKVKPLAVLEDEGLFDVDETEPTREQSRLSKTLHDIIKDKSALCYFIQYMETRNASQYIMCWLDIDTFKSDLTSCPSTASKIYSPVPNSKVDHDSLSVSTDCDSYTADSNSLFDYATGTLSEGKITPQEVNGLCDKDSDNSVRIKCEDIVISEKKLDDAITDNAVALFKKYIAQEATCNIRCSEELRKETMENLCTTDKVLSGNCFDNVQNFVWNIMETEYFHAFLGTDFFCKHQIDVLTSGNVALDDILYNETALFYFMEFLEQENNRGLLEFWIAATNFQQQLHDQKDFFDPVEAQNDAVVLYDKYFSLQAHCPLGFGDKVRFAVEQNICGENGLNLDCFHLPLKIIERALDKNYLKPFLASQLFFKYLSEVINAVQSNGYSTNIERNKNSPSDCSSERSFSTNTFLALEMDGGVKKREKANMNIDTRELYDPDALWRRRKTHRLSCGRVSDLGKYETDFEPEPDRKEFKLKDMVRKFVSLEEEHRKKEEMAYQVAEMIVRDVTSITLNNNKV